MNSCKKTSFDSKYFKDGRFQNFQPVKNDMILAFLRAFKKSSEAKPKTKIQTQKPDWKKVFPADEIVMTWFGHSTMLLEIDGLRILTDPVWSDRVSPSQSLGPKRFYDPVIPISELPKLDAILVSHNHYDHLDAETVRQLAKTKTRFVTALGVGSYLQKFGVSPELITELDWWESTKIESIEIVCTPGRHFSGRGLADRDKSLWGSWCFLGKTKRAFFSGDSGVAELFKDIGNKYGPFDLTLIEIGAYDPAWPHVHLGPDNAWAMHKDLKGKIFFPVHWGLFDLAFHAWNQPIDRLCELEKMAPISEARVLTRPPGERFAVSALTELIPWWK